MTKKFVLKVLLGMAAVMLLSACAGSPAAPAGTAPAAERENSITVIGSGQAVGEPDQATIRLGHVARNSSVSQAIETSNEVLGQMREAIQAQGVAAEDIQTTNFSIFSEEPRLSQPVEVEGSTSERVYRVENTLVVTVRDIDQVAAVIEAALDNGANNVHGLQFGIGEQDDLAAEARTAAVADARERAEQLAAELGLELGEVLEVNERGSGGVGPVRETAMGIGGGAPPISEGTLAVNAQVEITFALGQSN